MSAVFCGRRIAGDFYDAVRVSPQRVLFALLDVAGRREDTRAILVSAQKIFRTVGCELFAPSDLNESLVMTELCHLMNRGIMDAAAGVHSCPAFLGCYNEELGTLCYTNAGHTPGLVRAGTGILELASTGLPLGLFSHSTCDGPTIALEKESILLLVSRGVIEAEGNGTSAEDIEFGIQTIKDRLRNVARGDPQSICTAILHPKGPGIEPSCGDDRTALAFFRIS